MFNVYVAPLPLTGGSIELSKDSTAVPVTKLAGNGAGSLHWSADSRTVHWMVGSRYPRARPAGGAVCRMSTSACDLPTDAPTDVVAFTGGRVVTMRDADSRARK